MTLSKRKNKTYTQQFKEETVALVTDQGVVRQTLTRQKKPHPGTSPTQHKALSIRKVNCFFDV
jgi:hypothetical protein